MPEVFSDFVKIANNLEKVYKNMQDMEFTIEDGKLFMLQTRNGKRTAKAAIKIAVDMVKEKLITDEEAVMMVEPQLLEQLLHPKFDEKALASKDLLEQLLVLLLVLLVVGFILMLNLCLLQKSVEKKNNTSKNRNIARRYRWDECL